MTEEAPATAAPAAAPKVILFYFQILYVFF